MTDQAIDSEDQVEEAEGSEDEAEPQKKFLSGKKIVLFIVVPIVILLAAGAGLYFSGMADSFLGKKENAAAAAKERLQEQRAKAVFFDLPELLVNLNSTGRRTNFLKISISLELAEQADLPRVTAVLPRIIDSFQVYLRELRVSDLRGSAGMYRLREDLLRRVNEAAQPVKINDVLFKEMLIQ